MTQDYWALVDAWQEKYKPIKNHLSDNASWDGTMFETYDAQEAFVFSQSDENVWTWVDGDDGTYIVAGRAFVNRIGYFITEVPWTSIEECIQVDENEDDEYDSDDEEDSEWD